MRDLARKLRDRAIQAAGIRQIHDELAGLRTRRGEFGPTSTASKVGQLGLVQQWRSLRHRGEPLPTFDDVEFRACSQNGEDGILLYLFTLLGTTNRRAVEICAGNGIQCNSANLLLNHHWEGMLFEGDELLIVEGREFYARHPDTFCFPPRLVHAWIDREGINDLIRRNGFEGDVDLLSLDMDGVDYWIWEAIEVIRPRVVVAEVQCLWGAARSVTVPYSRDFRSTLVNGFGVHAGASLPAFAKLGRRKGYRLVGVQSLGFNAFFVRDGVGEDVLPEVSVESCVDRPFVRWAERELRPLAEGKEWVEV